MDFQNFVNERVSQAAHSLAPGKGIDRCGRDRDDYRSLLHLRVLECLAHAEKNDVAVLDRCAYVNQAIINQVRTFRRELARTVSWTTDEVVYRAIPDDREPNPENRVLTRDILRRVRCVLAESEWSMLVVYLDSGCNTEKTWRTMGAVGGHAPFRRRLDGVRQRCQDFLQKIA